MSDTESPPQHSCSAAQALRGVAARGGAARKLRAHADLRTARSRRIRGVKDGTRTKILVASIEKRRASLPSYHLNKSSPPPPHKRSRKRRK